MRKIKKLLLVLTVLSLISPSVVSARDISITANKSSLSPDEDLIITASASGFLPDETVYVKGSFFKETESNYFGYTKNNNDWIKNSASSTSQRQIKLNEWDLRLLVKNDYLDTGFKGTGGYKLKLGFYYMTSGGNLSPVNWSMNTLDISLNQPTSTPTQAPTVTLTPTAVKMSTVTVIPTQVVTLTKAVVMKTQINSITPKNTAKRSETSKKQVLGSNVSRPVITEAPSVEKNVDGAFVFPPVFLVIGVLVIILACGILLFQEWKKQKSFEI